MVNLESVRRPHRASAPVNVPRPMRRARQDYRCQRKEYIVLKEIISKNSKDFQKEALAKCIKGFWAIANPGTKKEAIYRVDLADDKTWYDPKDGTVVPLRFIGLYIRDGKLIYFRANYYNPEVLDFAEGKNSFTVIKDPKWKGGFNSHYVAMDYEGDDQEAIRIRDDVVKKIYTDYVKEGINKSDLIELKTEGKMHL